MKTIDFGHGQWIACLFMTSTQATNINNPEDKKC